MPSMTPYRSAYRCRYNHQNSDRESLVRTSKERINAISELGETLPGSGENLIKATIFKNNGHRKRNDQAQEDGEKKSLCNAHAYNRADFTL